MLGGRYRSDIRYQAPLLVSYPISAGFISENIGYGTDMVRPRDGPYLFHIRYETRRDANADGRFDRPSCQNPTLPGPTVFSTLIN